MIDNMAYGKVDSKFDVTGHIKLGKNDSYDSTSQIPTFDEGEYSYTMTSLPVPVDDHQTDTHVIDSIYY